MSEPTFKFYAFIGRLNPPHEGHIYSIMQVIDTAKRNNTKAILYLGSGPGGKQTLDDPLTHETKREIVEFLLDRAIRQAYPELESPPSSLYEIYKFGGEGGVRFLEVVEPKFDAFVAASPTGKIDNMDVRIFSSTKEGDDKKREPFLRMVLTEKFTSKIEKDIQASISQIEPKVAAATSGEKPLSATDIRILAYRNMVTGDNSHFLENPQLIAFYGDKLPGLYRAISDLVESTYPSLDVHKETNPRLENLEYYIANREMKPKPKATTAKRRADNVAKPNSTRKKARSKSPPSVRGGSRRRRRRQSKRGRKHKRTRRF